MPLSDITSTPLPRLPARADDSHKGDYGRALLIGGSRNMSGAISLAGLATLRSGAGLVTLAVPRLIQDVVAGFSSCYMTQGLADENGQFSKAATGSMIGPDESSGEFSQWTCIGFGPGLGRSEVLTDLVEVVYRVTNQPMVVDADALFALAERPEVFAHPAGPRVLTPHPGEFARLTGSPYSVARRIEGAAALARGDDDIHHQFRDKSNVAGATRRRPEIIVVLKGHETVVTDGQRVSINQTGNPGMATGGSGDVLTGVITGFVCQGLSPFDAARLGAHVHGLAGDLAAAELGQVALIASDLIDYLPKAFQSLGSS